MTTFVPDSVIWAAAATGLRQAVAGEPAAGRAGWATSVAQWAGVATYAAQRPADPTEERARELASIFAGSGVDHLVSLAGAPGTSADELLRAAGRVLADDIRTPTGSAAGGGEPVPAAVTAAVLARCLAWHASDVAAAAPLLEVFTGHGSAVDEAPAPADREVVERLGRWLASRLGPDVVVERAVGMSGGFSRLMLDVSWRGPDGTGRAVVRVQQGGMFASDGRSEAAIMRAVAASGYPVPEVLWEETDSSVVGEPFFVMGWVEGAARLDDAALDDLLRALARLHALDHEVVDAVAAVHGALPGRSAADAIAAQLAHWRGVYESSAPHPVPMLERGFAWLESRLRPTGPTVVVHGDPGPGNALHDGPGIAAVIDWELAHVGDAAEDWSYAALVRGRRVMTPAQWKERLARTVGVRYDEDVWTAWEAYNCVKGACVNLTALKVFASCPRPTPDHLAIGVAVHLRFLDRVVALTRARPA